MIAFFIGFVIMNWNRLFWVFNYRVISAKMGENFEQPQREVTIEELLSAVWNKHRPQPEYIEKPDSIKISQISITSPLVFVPEDQLDNVSPAALKKYLDRGVLHYPGSALPGERGQVVILGHSAPPNWPKIKYDWVFSELNNLNKGDEIIIYYKNHQYVYSVEKTIFLEKGEELPDFALTKIKHMLVLVSCWPPGKDSRRIAVEAEQK